MSEFSLSPLTENRLEKPCANPWNVNYSAGGSSGGGAAAVAAGLVPVAIGSDSNGGCRLPSSFCGVFGFKPTRGGVPFICKKPSPPSVKLLFTEAIMSRSIDDLSLVLQVIGATDKLDHESYYAKYALKNVKHEMKDKFRIGVSRDFGFISVDQETLKIFEQALATLELAGHYIEDVNIPLDRGILSECHDVIVTDKYLTMLSLLHEQQEAFNQLTSYTQKCISHAREVTGLQYAAASMSFLWVESILNEALTNYDFLITPTTPSTPPLIEKPYHEIGGKSLDPHLGLNAFNFPCNMSGHPAISVPCGLTQEGLPIGLQIIGRHFDRKFLLNAVEKIAKHFNLGVCQVL